jgi:methionyl aminopeptidase
MINTGRKNVFIDEADDWTVYTEDGGLSAQWEYTVLVTETGAEVLSW